MKKGITISVLAIAVAIMAIAVSTALVIGTKNIKSASYEEYISKLKRVEDEINLYEEKYDALPITGEILSKVGANQDFLNALNNNGDNLDDLYIIDMDKLNVVSVNIGYGSSENNDIFLIASNSKNLYYFAGMEYRGITRYNIER